jgi:acetyl-CoA acetyltransferase
VVTIAIVGVGESDISRRSAAPEGVLVRQAIDRALADAGLSASSIDGLVIEGMGTGSRVPLDGVARSLCMSERPFSAQVSIAGAGLVGAPQMARLAIESGLASVVLVYFGLHLSSTAGGPYAVHAEDPMKAAFELPFGWYGQAVYFAAIAQRYRYEFGLEPAQLATVAQAAREHASRTPGALRPEPLPFEKYLDSALVADPLRKVDCCLSNDCAVAYVMTSLERARDLAHRPAVVAGVAIASAPVSQAQYFTQTPNYLSTPASRSGPLALAEAGVTPADVDAAELYDCFTITTILQLEDLGFAERGEGAAYVEDLGIGPGSPMPVNTHGGLLAHSYTLAGNHVVEAVRQLRGERGDGQVPNAEVVLVTGLGIPDHASLVLTVDR